MLPFTGFISLIARLLSIFGKVQKKKPSYMKKLFTLFFALGLFSIGFSQSAYLSSPLKEAMKESSREVFDIRIMMKDQVDIKEMDLKFKSTNAPHPLRSQQLNAALKLKAKNTQSSILEILKNEENVSDIHSLWIVNCIYAAVSKSTILKLAERTDIEHLALNSKLRLDKVEVVCEAMPPVPNGREIGLEKINAPAMWARGYTGRGAIAMSSDQGVDPVHAALPNYIGKYEGDSQGFFALNAPGQAPSNCGGHGTHTLGTAIGLDRLNNDTIGVAFNAAWLGARTICGDTPDENDNLASWQWALDPDGDSTTVDDMPVAIINSWWDPQEDDECNSPYIGGLRATEAAGIAVIFSAGNAGNNGDASITAPKNINYDLLNAFCTANLDGRRTDLRVNNSSSRGPSICGGDSLLIIKPEVAAPGTQVRSSHVDGSYASLTGTSMAAPHVAGAVCLLKEAFPFLLGRDFKEALYMSARDLGLPGEDNEYGRGIIDVDSAFLYLVAQGHNPVDPFLALDPVLVDIDAPTFYCGSAATPLLTIENQGTEPLKTLELLVEIPELGLSEILMWTGELLTNERTSFLTDALDIPVGTWEMVVTIQNPNGEPDMYLYNNRLSQIVGTLGREPLEAYLADNIDGLVCRNARVMLRNEFRDDKANSIDYQWFRTPTGGPQIGTGQAYLTPPLTGDRTYYADYVANYSVGLKSNEGTTTRISPIAIGGIKFDAHIPITLQSVVVYSNRRDICRVELIDGEGTSLGIREVLLNNVGENRMVLNFDIPRGQDYELKLIELPLFLSQDGAQFPYNIDGVMTLTGNSIAAGGAGAYYYFYDWEIEHSEPCGRAAVPVTVNSTSGFPVANFGVSSPTVDLNNDPTIQFTDASDNAESWDWNFGDGTRSTEQNPSHTYTALGEYLVSLTVTSSNGCTASVIETVQVVDASSSTKNFIELTGVQVYPNPTSNHLNIETSFAVAENLNIQLTDLLGRPVRNFQQKKVSKGTFRLDTADLSSGIYMLVIETETGRAVRKIMKI